MVDWDSAMHIEILNKFLGMEHRMESYDLTKTSELRGALEYAVGAYRDYYHYSSTLGSLIESFDESIEYFDTATWVNMSRVPENTDDLAMDCVSSLSAAYDNFAVLSERAEQHLSLMLKITLTAPTDVQIEILGSSFDIVPSDIDDRLENLYVALSYEDYHRGIPDNFEAFLTVLNSGEWTKPDLELPPLSESEPVPF
jgi:hypothetical protein